ncbi:MAG: dipeptide epimerase [Calditrichaeota bacterium]|nr:dipeptide epimerase [Calditrichota bacterium]MCB0302363.1 dipeptide epimerase [Calditrichota bacterium]MCB0312077.1 dipeptide epimerase [Calditrichota bacterium]
MLEIKIKRLDLAHTWTIARGSADYKENVFVKLEQGGICGFGEAAPNVRYGESAALTVTRMKAAAPVFEQHDLFHFEELAAALAETIRDQSCARAGLEMALLDWVGKALQAPLYRMWGLNPARAPLTSFSIGIDSPEVIQAKVEEAADYPILKIKLGMGDDEAVLGAVRRVTDRPLRVDANEGWLNKEEALEKIRWLADQNVEFVEQPLPAAMVEETAWLRERAPLPIVADEAVKTAADIPKVAHAYDGINIKLMKSGGLLEALRMIHLARALDLKIMLGCMIESSLAISAAAQLAPYTDWIDLDGNLLLREDPFRGVRIERGKVLYNELPGLGVEGDF